MALRFLHISDIHLNDWDELNSDYDQDADIRNELLIDIRKKVAEFGTIQYVLVGGDIAFKGKKEEYKVAREFLLQVTKAAGCSFSSVLMVPGNHDVDRSKIKTTLKILHDSIKNAKDDNERTRIINALRTEQSLADLNGPLENYFNFASEFECVPESPAFRWEKNLQLDGYPIKIFGLNSAFVSNKEDDLSPNKQLLLGSFQRAIPNSEPVINIVMSHHPPKWLLDGDLARRLFRDRCKLQLFGHMHEAEEETINDSLVVHAGALHPERDSGEWNPRYNIIQLDVVPKENGSDLRIEIWMRAWDKKLNCFQMVPGRKDALTLVANTRLSPLEETPREENTKISDDSNQMTTEIMNTASETARRELVFSFFQLSLTKRWRIAQLLQLEDNLEVNSDPVKRTQRILLQAKEKELFGRLWELIRQANPDSLHEINPFIE